MLEKIKLIQPKKKAFLIDNLIGCYKHTIVTGASQLHRECFISDIAFTMAYGLRFHGRFVHPVINAMRIIYVGKPDKLASFLWAWNYDRQNTDEECPILCLPTPRNVDVLVEDLKEIYAEDDSKPLVVIVENNLGFEYPPTAYRLHYALANLSKTVRLTSILSLEPVESETGNQALYEADTHIKLENDLKNGSLVVNVVKNELNDLPSKFALAKRVIDCIMVLADCNSLDESVTLLYEWKKAGVREQIRIIDMLAALNATAAWPTVAAVGRVLGVTSKTVEPALRRLQNMGYIDRDTCSFTPKGLNALRNHGLTRSE